MKTFTNGEGKFCLKMNYGKSFLSAEEISYIEGDGNYSIIINKNGKQILSSFTLRKFTDYLLDEGHFFVARKGLLLNLQRLQRIEQKDGKLYAVMISQRRLPLSRRKGKALIDYIHNEGLNISIK
ncbi:LytTR family transcriptional regulator DNA-binding domain-containing protein [Jiulongibacter sp. NS-SX5]|uniref:LytTR family transcriptional regulator DNA-binding domain-containing protein n=1 Tax=Jiulongibacter sp. NS-SX5 TaxID=3463854 RepID=UPI004059C1E0